MRKLINLNDMLKWDSTILDDYVLPDTIIVHTDNPDEPVYSITLDHDIMSSNIVLTLGNSTPRFNEPDVFKNALNLWFLTHQWNIEHLMRLAAQNYNPLENYDRWEHLRGTNTLGGTDSEVHSGSDTEAHSGSDVTTSSNNETETHSGADTTEDTTSAMNASTYQPSDKSTLTHGEVIQTNSSGNSTLAHGENINTSYGEHINTSYGKTDTNIDNNHIHGNIGVTTAQDMARQEISLVATFNIYQNIVSLIENDLFMCVY